MELLCDEDSDTRAQATASLMRLELDLMGLALTACITSNPHIITSITTTCSLTPSPPAPSHHHHLLPHTITTCSLTPSPPAPSHHHHLLPHTITTYSLTPSPPASSHHTLPSPPAPSHHHHLLPHIITTCFLTPYPPITTCSLTPSLLPSITTCSLTPSLLPSHHHHLLPHTIASTLPSSSPAPSHHRFYPPIITTTSIAVITKAKHAMVEQGAIPLLTAQLQHSSSEVRLNTIKVRVCVCAGAHTGDNPLPQALTLLAETPKGKGELRAQLEKVRNGEEEQMH